MNSKEQKAIQEIVMKYRNVVKIDSNRICEELKKRKVGRKYYWPIIKIIMKIALENDVK